MRRDCRARSGLVPVLGVDPPVIRGSLSTDSSWFLHRIIKPPGSGSVDQEERFPALEIYLFDHPNLRQLVENPLDLIESESSLGLGSAADKAMIAF